MKKELIIIDLDGPILDGRERHYRCYQEIIAEMGFEPVDIDLYWKLKRTLANRYEILKLSQAEEKYDSFLEMWMERIEQDKFLSLDKTQKRAKEKLTEWKEKNFNLVLATMRKNSDALIKQLERLKIHQLFDKIVVCQYEKGGEGKAIAVKEQLPDINPASTLWIGDTEADVTAARTISCQIWALSCGLRNSDYLDSLKPDFLTEYLHEVDLTKTRFNS